MIRGVRIKDQWREQRLFDQRVLIAGAVIALLTMALVARLFTLQVVRYEHYAALSLGNRVRVEPVPAARGLIFDRHEELLAGNQPAYQLELIPEEVKDVSATLRRLAELDLIAHEEIEDLERTIRSRRRFESVPIRLRMSDEDVARFAVRRFEFPGVDIRTRQTRWYPHGELAVHALGYVGAISEKDLERIDRSAYSGTTLIGKVGVESAYESELHGVNGFREILVNAQGRAVPQHRALADDLRSRAPIAGRDLLLALDLHVQRVAEETLGDHRGAIVALDPNTGDVIALASRPGFDPNLFARGITRAQYDSLQNDIDRPLINRALRGSYPPGSTIKPIVALAGLKYGVTTPQQTVACRGYFSLPGSRHRFRDWKPQGHGTLNMIGAIAQSCDVYFYRLADDIGVDRLSAFMAHFGFGRPTGIDIGGERAGLLPSREWKKRAFSKRENQVWFPGETVIFGIGQGYLNATPMQLAQATAIIASRGKRYKPRLVIGVRDPRTGETRRIAPVLEEEITVASPDDWQRIIDGMIAVTRGGTASRSALGAPYTIAGKTGTAQVFSVAQNARYDESKIDERLRDHAWFVAFAPAEAPRIAVAVLVENGRSGSGTAAPMARKVMDAYLLDAEGKLRTETVREGT